MRRWFLTTAQLLLRYVDDYCFATIKSSHAKRFLDAMNAGE